MDPVSITSIVLASVSLAASIITPIIVAGAHFINRVVQSDCCCGLGHVELTPEQQQQDVQKIEKQKSILNKLNDLIKK